MHANTAKFDAAAPAYGEFPARIVTPKVKAFLLRFLKHAVSGGAPVWHVATMGQIMSQKHPVRD
jgi:hypothetical protein